MQNRAFYVFFRRHPTHPMNNPQTARRTRRATQKKHQKRLLFDAYYSNLKRKSRRYILQSLKNLLHQGLNPATPVAIYSIAIFR